MRRPLSLALATAACLFALTTAAAEPRPREPMDAARIESALRRLQVTGTVLYVGAHPDDENTAFLAYLQNGRGVRTAYLSLTRGDGGQNLIGSETGEALGVIRTQELLSARRIDGAEQFFTRALDFGYSKKPEETLEIWGHDAVLADVVYVIRRFQPDVIVTRFGTDGSGGHGHHTASAILAGEAFRAAADPTRFPEQLSRVGVWQAKRLLWNNWRARTEGRDPALPRLLTADLGAYDPLLGRAYTEIAGLSRSMHKSQGFGAPERRGTLVNYFEHVDGTKAEKDLLDSVELTWKRAAGGERVEALLRQAELAFDSDHPGAIVPALIDAYTATFSLPAAPWIDAKRRELAEVIRNAAGLWVEAIAARPSVAPGAKVAVNLSLLNRSEAPFMLEKIDLPPGSTVRVIPADSTRRAGSSATPLPANRPVTAEATVSIPADAPSVQPYWLRAPTQPGAYGIDDPALIGDPENLPTVTARLTLGLSGRSFVIEAPVVYRWVDPVLGERYRQLEVVPPVTCRFEKGVYVFADAKPREVRVIVESADSSVTQASASLELPPGWRSVPPRAEVRFAPGEREKAVAFQITPGATPARATVSAEVVVGADRYTHRLVRLDYPHIPIQTLLPPAEAKLVRADVRIAGSRIGYLMGSGDQGPDALRQMGFQVTLLSDEDAAGLDLARFDTIVIGVRAFNTRPRLLSLEPRLLEYASAGGRLVVQYQTPDASLVDRLGPFPFTVSRERVTVEGAPIQLLKADHPLLRAPNPIGAGDFEGWVQERGLSYAKPWDPRYETLLAAADPGEEPLEGGLLFARHGRGSFIYTGLSFFRQLPAGVPGAYRLFANLVSAPQRP